MKSHLIVNPVSGTDSASDYLRVINERLRERVGELDIVLTIGPGDATRAAEAAARENCEQLFVAGGDGTLNEVLNGVAAVEGALGRITFGLVPLGTGNDFAAGLGIPEEIEAALDVLATGRVIEVDVGSLNDRRFVNVSAGGFIAEVSDAVNPQLKTLAGKLAYLVGGAQVLMDYKPVRARFRITADDGGTAEEREMSLEMFAVCNSRLVGGGRLIAPHALMDNGLLDVCVIEEMPMLEFIALLTRVSGGEHVEDERVSYFQARELTIEFARTMKVNTDGEVLETNRCHYAVSPRAARFLAGDAPYMQAGRR